MNKIKLFLILPFFFMLFVQSQAQSETYVGIKGGLIKSSFVSGDKSTQQKNNEGFNAGLFFNISALKGWMSIQSEILYTQKGTSLKLPTATNHHNLTYIEVPLLLKINVPVLGAINPNVFAGPYGAVVFKKEYGYNKDSNLVPDYTINNFDYGGIVGAGLDVNLTKSFQITFDGRYAFGFEKVRNIKAEDIKNGAFSLNLGLGFKL